MTERGYDWRHGWVPLTMHAALQKAHGNHAAAEALLGQARAARAARREAAAGDFWTPIHDQPAPRTVTRRALRELTDDELAEHLGDTDDDAALDAITAELDRRDRAQRKREAERARRARARLTRDAAQEADFDARLAAGEDAEEAFRAAYGITEERQRREEATASLRSSGYRGKGFDQLCRAAFTDHAAESYLAAESVTRGHLLSPAGKRAGVDPRSLFTGPESRARKYASEELLGFWQDNARLTVDDFRASLLGGHMRHVGTAAFA